MSSAQKTFAIQFPPFPPNPPGARIVPFAQFRECGIQIELGVGDEDVELDGRGIPTVEMSTKHDNDESKSEARKRRKTKQWVKDKAEEERRTRERASKPATSKPSNLGKPVVNEWWKDWEDGESLRRTVVDISLPPLDRISQAVQDFAKHRRWPPSSLGIFHSWDKFRFYIGLLDNSDQLIPAQKTAKPVEEDEISDEEELAEPGPTVHNVTDVNQPEKKPHRAYDSATLKEPPKSNLTSEEKLAAFLADPERSTKVFLSSYMRARGIMWAERNLVYVPRLVIFFFQYLLRSAVFDVNKFPFKRDDCSSKEIEETHTEMRHINEGLLASLEVAEKALEELPLTAIMAQWVEPFSLSEAAKGHWGKKADGYKILAYSPTTNATKDGEPTDSTTQGKSKEEEEEGHIEVQRCVVEVTGIVQDDEQGDEESGKKKKGRHADAGPSTKRVRLLDEEDKDNVQAQIERARVPDLDPKLIDAKTAIEDNMDVDAVISPPWMKSARPQDKGKKPAVSVEEVREEDEVPVEESAGGWGDYSPSVEGGWGTGEPNGWGDSPINGEVPSGFGDGWDVAGSADDWAIRPTSTLQDVLGKSNNLAKTHTPGLVESSLRRVKAVLLPGEGIEDRYAGKEVKFDCEDPEEMETQLARRFVRVILEPWLYTDVKQEAGMNSLGRIERRMLNASTPLGLPGKGLPLNEGKRLAKVHNLLGDEITILVDAQGEKGAEVLEVLKRSIGMGLGGYFIELARVADTKDHIADDGSDIEMDDWDDRVTLDELDDWRRYWYMEELTRVYPSYWLPLGLKKRDFEKPFNG